MDFGSEDVVGFEEAGKKEEGEHDAGGPGEYLKRESRSKGWVGFGFRFAKDDCAQERDRSRDDDEHEAVEKAVGEDLGGLKDDGMRVFEGEEEGAEDSVKGEHAEEKSCEFSEFEQCALEDFGRGEFVRAVDEGDAVGGDPHILEAVPDGVAHGVLP